jgi:hypothetical protein
MKLPLHIELDAAGLGGFVMEHEFHPDRKFRGDYCWIKEGIILEVEGGTWGKKSRHTSGKGYEGDCHKYNEAAILGWMVIRCTTPMVRNGDAITYVRKALEARRKLL